MSEPTIVESFEALKRRILDHDCVTSCACCGVKLAWHFAGDGTGCVEAITGETHNCPVSSEDFQAGKFPAGTYRHAEHRAITAERERDEARAVLKSVEWLGGDSQGGPYCPYCGADHAGPHRYDCKLALAINAPRNEPKST